MTPLPRNLFCFPCPALDRKFRLAMKCLSLLETKITGQLHPYGDAFIFTAAALQVSKDVLLLPMCLIIALTEPSNIPRSMLNPTRPNPK